MTEQIAIHPEVSDHHLVSVLDRLHADEYVSTPNAAKEFVDGLNFEQFEDHLNRINGIARAIPTKQRMMDGAGHIVSSNAFLGWSIVEYIPPATEDRKDLMRLTFDAVKNIDDPVRAATLLGIAINVIHPYGDGNGRTSRVAYSLLARGYDGSPESKTYYSSVLENTTGRKIVDLNPEKLHLANRFCSATRQNIARAHGYDGPVPTYLYGGYHAEFVEDQNAKTIKVNNEVSMRSREKLHAVLADERFGTTVFMDLMLDKDDIDLTGHIKTFDGGRNPLTVDALTEMLTNKDIEDLASRHFKLKYQYVEALIRLFSNDSHSAFADEIVEYFRPKVDAGAGH